MHTLTEQGRREEEKIQNIDSDEDSHEWKKEKNLTQNTGITKVKQTEAPESQSQSSPKRQKKNKNIKRGNSYWEKVQQRIKKEEEKNV